VLVALAVLALSAAAYGIFLVTHLPQSVAIDAALAAKPSELFRLKGPGAGPLITMTLRGPGFATISAPGARLAAPTPGTLALLAGAVPGFKPSPRGVELRVTNDAASLATIAVALVADRSADASVDIRPRILPDGSGFAITATGAALRASLDWSSPPPGKPNTGPVLMSDDGALLPLGRAVIDIPAGAALFIGSSAGANIRFDLGNSEERFATGGLAVRGLELRGAESASPTSLACGKPAGTLRPGLSGSIGTNACDAVLHVQAFKLDDQAHLQLSGSGFWMQDGAVRYWPLMADVASNIVLQGAFTAAVGFLTAWVTFWLGFRKPKEG